MILIAGQQLCPAADGLDDVEHVHVESQLGHGEGLGDVIKMHFLVADAAAK